MMKIYAQITDQGIVNGLLQTTDSVVSPLMIQIQEYDDGLLGKLYVNGEFIDPPEPEPITWGNAPAEYYWLEVGSFYDRFGPAKIAVLASPDATVQALVRDTQVRKYIDLQRPDVAQFVGYLSTVVDEVTPEVAAAVLAPPTTDDERYIKGLPQPIDPEP